MEAASSSKSKASPRHSKGKPAVPSDDSDEEYLKTLQEGTSEGPVDSAAINRPVNTGFKVAFTNLPAGMSEDDFIAYFGPLPKNNHFFYQPPSQIGMMPPSCMAVINFLDKNELADWFEKLHGLMLTDERGEEYWIEGDIMINQELPKFPVVEGDELEGTLEDTEEFQEFQDHYEDTDGVFSDPPLPAEVIQEIMLKEIEERDAKADVLQETPLVLYFREKNKGEREKARIREEKEAAREKRHQERKEQRAAEKKERRDKEKYERAAKEKLRKEAARRAKRAKQKTRAADKGDSQAPLANKVEGAEVPVEVNVNPESAVSQPQSSTTASSKPAVEDAKESQKNNKEVPSTSGRSKEKDERRYGGKSNARSSSKPWDRETTWSKRSNKWDQDKDRGGNWRQGTKSAESKSTKDQAPREGDHTPTASTSTATNEPGALPSTSASAPPPEPKKKIVKKIIKVKKVRSNETVEEEGGSASARVKVPLPQNEPAQRAVKVEKTTTKTTTSADAPKQSEAKRKPNRPDREVYRPGAWRRNSGAGVAPENRKPETSRRQEPNEGSLNKPKSVPPTGTEGES